MTTSEVLRSFPGLNRDLLYFWEKRNWIVPDRNEKGRRDYNEEHVRKIAIMWKAYGEGYSPKRAYERVSLTESLNHPEVFALLKASTGMVDAALHGKVDEALRHVTQTVAEHLRAEVCTIFLVAEDSRDYLRLVDQFGGTPAEGGRLIAIRSVPKSGLTGHLALQGEKFRDHGESLRNHPNATGEPPKHLASQKCFSLMALPLQDHKGRLLGLLKVENKQPLVGPPSDAIFFDRDDEAVAQILANEIVLALQTLRILDATRDLLKAMNETQGIGDFLARVLAKTRFLLHADRGDVAWADEGQQRVLIRDKIGPSKLPVNSPLPEHSITHRVFATGLPYLCQDVSQEPIYYPTNDNVRSEVAVPIKFGNQVLGVLNAESFQVNAFDKQDQALLEQLADMVGLVGHLIEHNEYEQARAYIDMQSVLSEVREQKSSREVLQLILRKLAESDFDRTRIFEYKPEEEPPVFRCFDSWDQEQADKYRDLLITIPNNHYAEEMAFEWKEHKSARIRNPAIFGPDPNAAAFDKPADLEWAVAPLAISGKLYGYLAADNKYTRRTISRKNLRRMELYAALAAQSIANISAREKDK